MGREAVGGGRLGGGVGLVGGGDGGAAMAQRLDETPRERAQPAELADHDPQVGQRAGVRRQRLELADGGDPGAGAGLAGEHLQGTHRARSADPVDDQARVALEVLQGLGGAGPEDAVDAPAVEADPANVACSSPTSSPRRLGATSTSSRSPSFHEASTSARQVSSSQVPVVRNPR